jgi:hypothetical protein
VTMCLTPAELADLTGLSRKSGQAAWLAARGYPFELSESGHPKVLRAFVERKLGVKPAPRQAEPDFAALVRYGKNAGKSSSSAA